MKKIEKSDHVSKSDFNLAGPCGFYCGTCRHYLARSKEKLVEKHLKHGCRGCREQDKLCAWVKKGCEQLRKKQIDFCYQCEQFPCDDLRKLDERHVQDDNISLIDNLYRIRKVGPEQWLAEQRQQWSCPNCGGEVCVMDHECYDCGAKI